MSSTSPPLDWPSTWPGGWTVEWVAETGSTNADLLVAAANGASHRSVLAAGHQTAGRGRLDRRWDAPPGANLLVSLLFHDVPTFTHQLTQRVALAAVAACRSITGRDAVLKWPNDVVLDGAKLAGVLAQTGLVGARRTCVVVGIGVNIGWAPPDAICLGDAVGVGRFLAMMLSEHDALPAVITPLYRERLSTIGQVVRVELPGDRFIVGRAVDVEPDGRLVVLDDCAVTHRIDTGDVVHLRPSLATD